MVQVGHSVFLIIDGWQWSRLGSRFYLTPSVPRFNPGVMISKTGVAIAVTLYSLISQFVYDLEFPALLSSLSVGTYNQL